MSTSNDVQNLRATIASSDARRARYEALTRASRLMREAAAILESVPPTERTTAASALLIDACEVLVEPADEPEEVVANG